MMKSKGDLLEVVGRFHSHCGFACFRDHLCNQAPVFSGSGAVVLTIKDLPSILGLAFLRSVLAASKNLFPILRSHGVFFDLRAGNVQPDAGQGKELIGRFPSLFGLPFFDEVALEIDLNLVNVGCMPCCTRGVQQAFDDVDFSEQGELPDAVEDGPIDKKVLMGPSCRNGFHDNWVICQCRRGDFLNLLIHSHS